MILLFQRGEIADAIGDATIFHLAVRRLDETVLVHPRVGSKRGDETDIGTLRGFNRADSTIMGGMNVPDLESRPLTGQTSRTQCREATLVGNLRERVGLIHELGELAGAKKRSEEHTSELQSQ